MSEDVVAHLEGDLALGAVGTGYRDSVVAAAIDLAERVVFHRVAEHRHHVARGGVHIASPVSEVKPMGVGERGVHAQLGRLVVHLLHKVAVPAALARNRNRRVVAGFQHQAVQRVAQGERFALAQVHG